MEENQGGYIIKQNDKEFILLIETVDEKLKIKCQNTSSGDFYCSEDYDLQCLQNINPCFNSFKNIYEVKQVLNSAIENIKVGLADGGENQLLIFFYLILISEQITIKFPLIKDNNMKSIEIASSLRSSNVNPEYLDSLEQKIENFDGENNTSNENILKNEVKKLFKETQQLEQKSETLRQNNDLLVKENQKLLEMNKLYENEIKKYHEQNQDNENIENNNDEENVENGNNNEENFEINEGNAEEQEDGNVNEENENDEAHDEKVNIQNNEVNEDNIKIEDNVADSNEENHNNEENELNMANNENHINEKEENGESNENELQNQENGAEEGNEEQNEENQENEQNDENVGGEENVENEEQNEENQENDQNEQENHDNVENEQNEENQANIENEQNEENVENQENENEEHNENGQKEENQEKDENLENEEDKIKNEENENQNNDEEQNQQQKEINVENEQNNENQEQENKNLEQNEEQEEPIEFEYYIQNQHDNFTYKNQSNIKNDKNSEISKPKQSSINVKYIFSQNLEKPQKKINNNLSNINKNINYINSYNNYNNNKYSKNVHVSTYFKNKTSFEDFAIGNKNNTIYESSSSKFDQIDYNYSNENNIIYVSQSAFRAKPQTKIETKPIYKFNNQNFNIIKFSSNKSKTPITPTKGNIIRSKTELTLIEEKITNKTYKIQLHLLYKASINSDSSLIFHELCNNINSTVVLIKTKQGNRFGGFTRRTWNGHNISKKDDDAFIFSLDKMKTYDVIKNQEAIICAEDFGPIFSGYQIRIPNEVFKKGGTTDKKGLGYNTTVDYELTNGNRNFGVEEIEVYEVQIK